MKQFFQKLYLVGFFGFNVSVMVFAVTLILAGIFPAHAQSPIVIQDLARRITDLEALNLDHRLTVIETILNDLHADHWTHLGTMVGTGLLIMERAARAVTKKAQE